MSFSYQYEAVKEAARQQEREFDRNTPYQPEAAAPAEQAVAQRGGWRERIMRVFTPARRNEASPECGQQPR